MKQLWEENLKLRADLQKALAGLKEQEALFAMPNGSANQDPPSGRPREGKDEKSKTLDAEQGRLGVDEEEFTDATGRGRSGKGKGNKKKEDSQEGDGVTQQTLSAILKLMEGMRKIQDRMSKGSSHDPDQEPETVRQSVDLPKLPEWQGESAPIDFSDWLVVLASLMADLTPTSEERWSLTLEEARSWYQKHLLKSPLDRLTHQIAPSAKLTLRKWARLEKRAAALLLSAVPESLREEVVSSRSLSTFGILVKGMIAYQPGSLSERQAILGHDLAQMAEVEKAG